VIDNSPAPTNDASNLVGHNGATKAGASLLVMAKEPKPGSAKTRLIPVLTAEKAAALAECFLFDSVELGNKAATEVDNLDVKIACTPPSASEYFQQHFEETDVVAQVGQTLGERLDHVLGHALDAGYEMVAAINSDGPSLPMSSIVAAFESLASPDVDILLGPTEDGGYYLIGVKQRWPEVTIDVEMSTPNVLTDTLAVASQMGARVELLPTWFDVDEPKDLARLQADIAAGISCGQHTVDFIAAQRPMTGIETVSKSAKDQSASAALTKDISVAVIAPALNESGNIGAVVTNVLANNERGDSKASIPTNITTNVTMIVVDNGSSDDTVAEAVAAGADVVTEDRRGYGYACKAGAVRALELQADILVFIDGDQSSRADELPRILEPITNGSAELVLGSRTRGTIDKGAMAPHQRFGNWLTSRMMRSLYQIDVTDLGPYRGITAELYRKLNMTEMTFGWPTEMMVKAAKTDANVVEVPVTWMNRVEGKSKVSGLAAWHILKVTIRYARS